MRVLALLCLLTAHSIFAFDGLSATENEETGVTIQDFFRTSKFAHFTISPDGEWLAYSESLNDRYVVYLTHVDSMTTSTPHIAKRFTSEAIKTEHFVRWVDHDNRIAGITWLGNRVISIKENDADSFRRFKIVKLDFDDHKAFEGSVGVLNHNGYWANPLTRKNKSAIFAKYSYNEEIDYHVDLFNLKLSEKNLDSQTRYKKRLNKKGPKVHEWLTDNKGYRTLGVRTVNDVPELYIRDGKKPKKYRYLLAWKGKENDYLEPAFYDNSGTVLVITDHGTDKRVLREFDRVKGELGKIVYQHPDYDVKSVMLSSDKQKLLGVTYYQFGYYKQHFFDDQLSQDQEKLIAYSGSANTFLVDIAKENNSRIFNVYDSDNSGELFIYRDSDDSFHSLMKLKPWLKNTQLQKSELIQLKNDDGSLLEAFVTLPKNRTEPAPLVVIPHGGPIGVSDSRHYSANIQVLVNAGFATLQVNYRGSAGYGKHFKATGMGQWGKAIENDIEQALAYTKQHYPVNKDKVCIVGASYGGYSALFSLIRSPELYQCAASYAGVTDLALLFQRSDIENDDDVMSLLRDIVGDPDREQQKLFEYSPVYRASEITKPVFIAHGTADEVVDIEHAYRLRFALKANKVPYKWQVLSGYEHGFNTTEQAEEYYSQLIAFLNKHLKGS